MKLSKPDLQATVFTPIWRDGICSKGVTMTQYQGGGQTAKRKNLVSGNPQKLTACLLSPTFAINVRAYWHKSHSKPSSILTEIPSTPTRSFQWLWTLEFVLCSLITHCEWGLTLLSWFDWPPVALPLSFVLRQNGSVPAHPFANTLARWPSLCFSAGLHSSAALSRLQSAGISSKAPPWTRLRCWCTAPLLILHLLVSWGEPGSPEEILQYSNHCGKTQLMNCWSKNMSGHLVTLNQEFGGEILCKERSQILARFVLPAKFWWVRGGFVMDHSY